MTRPIVRDPRVMAGRWYLAGTKIPIAAIRRDGVLGGRIETQALYSFLQLTDAEYDRIMAFPFPEIRAFALAVRHADFSVECVCGEDTEITTQKSLLEVPCVCGRTWKITVRSSPMA